MKKLEVVNATGSVSRITIAKDRVTVKIAKDDPNLDLLQKLPELCKDIDPPQTLRGRVDVHSVERGRVTVFADNKRPLGYLDLNPVKFIPF